MHRRLNRTCSFRRWHSSPAVIPQTARRCDLLVWLLLRAATIAFAIKSYRLHKRHHTSVHHQANNEHWGFSKPVSGKSTSSDGDSERVCRLPANTVPIRDCDSACRKAADLFPPSVTAGDSRLLHSDNHRHPKDDFILRDKSLS